MSGSIEQQVKQYLAAAAESRRQAIAYVTQSGSGVQQYSPIKGTRKERLAERKFNKKVNKTMEAGAIQFDF